MCVFSSVRKDECILDGCNVVESRSIYRYLYDWDLCERFLFVFIIYHLKNLAESNNSMDFLCLSSNWIMDSYFEWTFSTNSVIWTIFCCVKNSIVFFSRASFCIQFKLFFCNNFSMNLIWHVVWKPINSKYNLKTHSIERKKRIGSRSIWTFEPDLLY